MTFPEADARPRAPSPPPQPSVYESPGEDFPTHSFPFHNAGPAAPRAAPFGWMTNDYKYKPYSLLTNMILFVLTAAILDSFNKKELLLIVDVLVKTPHLWIFFL